MDRQFSDTFDSILRDDMYLSDEQLNRESTVSSCV
jgi:hypothetical protein